MATAGKGTLFVYLQAAFWAACWVLCVGGCQPGLRPWTPLGASCGGLPAPRTPRPAFEKSGGKPAGKLFWVCNGLCWPAAHRERRARLVCGKAGRERVVDGSFGRRKIAAFPGGAAGAHSAHNAGAGAFGPRPCVGFAGPPGPPNAAAPPGKPREITLLPSSPRPRRPY